jgi:hypothetical protein
MATLPSRTPTRFSFVLGMSEGRLHMYLYGTKDDE